ncbi:MAG: hypothetical protein H0U88_01940 [Chthoniobacterales bacterium]|nr:hypothetical protein [Chthoniobacterales bacterium]
MLAIADGERGHYELAARRDPLPFILALEGFSKAGGMLPEQVWFGDESSEHNCRRGSPTGSAMPLCWAHAEYLSLVRSRADGIAFERIAPAHDRYVRLRQQGSPFEIWTRTHQIGRVAAGKMLRIVCDRAVKVRWSTSDVTHGQLAFTQDGLDLCHVDVPTTGLAPGATLEFQISNGHNARLDFHRVKITPPHDSRFATDSVSPRVGA